MVNSYSPRAITDFTGQASLTLPFNAPYPWNQILAYLIARAIPGVEAVSATAYRRSVRIDGSAAILDVRLGADGQCLTVSCTVPCDGHIDRLRRQFDLDADSAAIDRRLAADPLLAPLVARNPGLRVPGAWDPFELAVRAMVGQQVSVAGATTVTGRIARRFGTPLENPDGDLRYLFPTPQQLAEADMASLGMPGKRALAIVGLAKAVAEGDIALDGAGGLDDAVERLCALPGIGPWTAHYIAMRALGEADAFPAGDLGLRRAAAVDTKELSAMAENWRPWRAYAAQHLWMSLGEGSK